MKLHRRVLMLASCCFFAVLLSACGHAPVSKANSADLVTDSSTILLVSREDGTIVRQTVSLSADICMKAISESSTICLTQGDAIINRDGILVGYEMIEERIELRASY